MYIGIMQGRLSNKKGKPLQSFPWDDWKKEFSRAHSIGFNQIEWLVDDANNRNPISSVDGREVISYLSNKYDVSIKSLCAHTLIDGKLLSNGKSQKKAIDKFSKILSWAFEAKIEYVILPLMDEMSIQSSKSRETLKKILHKVVDNKSPTILFESDLSGIQLKAFIDQLELRNIGIVYDLGNATAMDFDIENDLKLLSPYIKEVHIKDRFINNGGSVRLGNADTPFHIAIRTLKKLLWNGSLILETPVFDNWEDEARANFSFTKNLIKTEAQNFQSDL
jgi:L-ribulose-5-phosphate 3-epimerase